MIGWQAEPDIACLVRLFQPLPHCWQVGWRKQGWNRLLNVINAGVACEPLIDPAAISYRHGVALHLPLLAVYHMYEAPFPTLFLGGGIGNPHRFSCLARI